MTGPERVDLHVHSFHSPDSRTSIETIVERLGVAGLQGVALTDHNTIAGHTKLKELQQRYPKLWLIPGVEVSTREGHLLVYGVNVLPTAHRPLAETLDWARSVGAIAALAHPFRWAHGVGRALAETAKADALETTNGHNSEIANARAELLAARRGIASIGGSDAHDADGIGRAFTEFPEGASTLDEFLDHLRRGRVRAMGRSLNALGRFRLGLRTGVLRASRGFRPI